MNKSEHLSNLYDELGLNTPGMIDILVKVRNQTVLDEEVNELFDLIKESPNGTNKLLNIKNFENNLITEFNQHIAEWKNLESDSLKVGYLETQVEIDKAMAELKSRYKALVQTSDETYEAIKIAYFQVDDFNQYYQQLYMIKDNLVHLEE